MLAHQNVSTGARAVPGTEPIPAAAPLPSVRLLFQPPPRPCRLLLTPPADNAAAFFPEQDFFAVKLKAPRAQLYLASRGEEVGGGGWPWFMQFLHALQFEAKQSNQAGLCQFAQNLLAL